MKEKISVIIPVYNAKKTLHECVGSVLESDDDCFELLLVDDASADGSAAICDELALADPRVRAIHAPHGGAAAARNRGIREAEGSFICFVDSDDLVETFYLSELRHLMEDCDADISACGHDKPREDEAGKCREHCCCGCGNCRCAHVSVYEKSEGAAALLYQRGLMSVPWGYLFRKELWKDISFPEGCEAEDMGTIYRLFIKAGRVAVTDRVCYHYIQRGSSTIYTTAVSRNKAYYAHSRRMTAYVKENMPECHRAALSRHFSTCAQILSETPASRDDRLLKRVYADMKKLSATVLRDRESRMMNRAAAAAAGISIPLLHMMLRVYQRSKLLKMRKA